MMNLFWSIILGIVQGLTEFLPVSSSGHLVLVQNLIPGFSQPGVLYDVILHAGTLFSILFYFRKTLAKLTSKYLMLLVIGTIPAGIFGILFQSVFESLFTSIKVVGIALIITGILNYFTDKTRSDKKQISVKDSLMIGIFQAIAIIPGISRSGSTIFAGTSRGINKRKAAEFSFLLSVPAVFGATILQFFSHSGNTILDPQNYIAGFLSAFASGIAAIYLVMNLLEQKKFKFFGVYCFVLGILALFT